MSLSVSTHQRLFPTKGFCFLCESQNVLLTHHSSIQKRNVCNGCAEALAWSELTLRLVGFRRPSELDEREVWDSEEEETSPPNRGRLILPVGLWPRLAAAAYRGQGRPRIPTGLSCSVWVRYEGCGCFLYPGAGDVASATIHRGGGAAAGSGTLVGPPRAELGRCRLDQSPSGKSKSRGLVGSSFAFTRSPLFLAPGAHR